MPPLRVSTAVLLAALVNAADISISWRSDPKDNVVSAARGDTVVLDWAGTTTVSQVATETEVCTAGPFLPTFCS